MNTEQATTHDPSSAPTQFADTMRQSQRKADKTLKLITQLLAKAENTPFPAEAQTFQEHAERLMVRYGIEQAEIDAEAGRQGRPQEPMVEERIEFSGQYRVGQSLGFSYIAMAFNTIRVLQSTRSSSKLLYLIGAESDVAQVVRLFTSLRVQMGSAMNAWWLNYTDKIFLTAHEKTLERRQFQIGFLATVAQRIAEIHNSEVAATGPGNQVALSSRRDRADQHAKELYPEVRRARSQPLSMGSQGAHAAGSFAGTLATVNGEVGLSSRRSLNDLTG